MPTETITILPSELDEKKSNVPNVFFIHPVEGLIAALKPLASLLPYKVYGIECVEDAPLDSINTLAAFYIKVTERIFLSPIFLQCSKQN